MIKKIKNLDIKTKRKIVFSLFCFFSVISLIIAAVLMALGIEEYKIFINQINDKTVVNLQDIVKFIYGLFFLVMFILLFIADLLYANHTFNKKYYVDELKKEN